MIADRSKLLDRREFHEQLLNRARFLDAADRALVEQVLGKGVLPREVAAVSGISTRSVQRRVQQLLRRLADPQVVFVLRQHRNWSPDLAEVAMALWVKRRTLRDTAKQMGLTLHQIRQQAQAVKTLVAQGTRSSRADLSAWR